jgi:hypothetical protein
MRLAALAVALLLTACSSSERGTEVPSDAGVDGESAVATVSIIVVEEGADAGLGD